VRNAFGISKSLRCRDNKKHRRCKMALIKWQPFKEFVNVRREIDKLFDDVLAKTDEVKTEFTLDWAPDVDVEETEDALIIHAEVPGINPKDVDIKIQGDTLTIKGERKEEKEEKKKNYLKKERSYGSFVRSFSLGIPIKQDAVKAKSKNGVLTITIPKAEEAKEKTIKVLVEEDK
jgi:HSP20 family protein